MKNIIIIGLSLILSVVAFGFITKPDEPIMYDYVQIMQRGKHIGISTSTTYSETNVDGEASHDFHAVLGVVEEYQRNGYEVVDHAITAVSAYETTSFLVRKKR
jgi:hypothetical protein